MKYALEWLAPVDLAYVALTSSAMASAVRNETLRRTRDVSRGTEAFPVPVFNSVDNCRYPYFEYAPASLPARPGNGRTFRWGKCFSQDSAFYLKEFGSDGCCCINCSQGFSSHDNYLHEENSPKRRKLSTCPCGRTIQGDPAYDSESRLQLLTQEYTGEQLSLIYECGAACMCDLSCRHRTTQRGLAVRANLVRHPKKGWCLHAAENIKTGTFICEYAGELLTTKEAQRRHSIYDKERKSTALLVVREHLPSGACLRLNIDATNVGNVARFMNHSCDSGNVFSCIVRSAGCYIPRLVFFAKRNIVEGEELTFSYGGVEEGSNTHPCFCGTPECIGMLPSERT